VFDEPFNRRQWLGIVPKAAGFAVGLSSTMRAQQYHIAGANFKLGIASSCFRKFSRTPAIEMTKQLGTPYLSVKDVHLPVNSTPEQIAAAKKEFHDAGIALVGCGVINSIRTVTTTSGPSLNMRSEPVSR
jgi:hypothetical protein